MVRMKDLVKNSYAMRSVEKVIRKGEVFNIELLYTENRNNLYSIHKGVLCFVYNAIVYVKPLVDNDIVLLQNNGFVEACFYVPFSHKEIPMTRYTEFLNVFACVA